MIKILVNGKQNPLGINFGKIRLDLKTELEYTPKQITFNLYKDLDSARNNQPFFTQTTDKYSIVIDSENLVEGQVVNQGQVSGWVSDNNRQEYKDGPHLHFEVLFDGNRIDPNEYLLIAEK